MNDRYSSGNGCTVSPVSGDSPPEEEGKIAVAGALVVPARRELEKELSEKLETLEGASVEGIGDKGIALVLEAKSVDALEKISETIGSWDEVADFQLAYLNWEEADREEADREEADEHR